MAKKRVSIVLVVSLVAVAFVAAACGGSTTTTTAVPTTTLTPGTTAGAAAGTSDIVDTAVAAGTFKTLVSLIQAAGLGDTLKGAGPFTVFAPTDDAFGKVPQATLDALAADPTGVLAKVLTYHVVPSKIMAADIKDGMKVKTVEGSELTFSIKDGQVYVNDAKVVTPDIATSNGVIHVIDSVLLPPDATPASTPGS
jgi:uncharacterized surface protein with fasciclin (FAS1) repeats